ncbi:hypothetical protein SKAU_G00196100 [Synaphobranchus kaupii]|uniref:Protein phosphatase inhibitor 2 n=1 Tax=Synaphobranchus kaupii TaxID=118154 RepID=A0A9Q1IXD0_SYNKA|nr:hypothetical protein SKAU_G00196100 [Synaphobranchus kaupii]
MAAPRPIKGILKNKNSGSRGKAGPQLQQVSPVENEDPGLLDEKKSQKWDEMNILATYHPADKDYGLMKIDEPSTPYNRMVGDEEDEGALSDSDSNTALTADDLARKLAEAEGAQPRFMREEEEEEEEESSEEEEEQLSPEEQAKKKHFQMMRKMHYNEGLNIKMARQLIEEEDDEDEEMKEDTEMEDVSENPPQDADSLDF